MRMVRAGVDLELAELLRAEAVPRQHALDGAADDLFGPPLEQVAEGLLLEALRVAAVADVELARALVAGDGDRAAFRTMTWSPESIDGVYVGLFLPSRTRAIRDASRPSVSSAASTTNQRRSISLSRSV